MQAVKSFDVVVLGASGFTGRLVCEHIARDYQGKVRWAMAGRDRAKLEEIKRNLTEINPGVQAVPVIVADAFDYPSLASLAQSSKVVINVAGPYAKYGDKVVEAAVNEGAHYCDLTGEVNWVNRMISRHHETAKQKGVKVVHCCGYDSVPFDIGVLVVADHIRKKLGKGTSQVFGLMEDARGGVSGGTIASAMNMAVAEDPSDVKKAMGDKYYLCPPGERGSDSASMRALLPEWNRYSGAWMAPFVMEAVNSRVVHRSNALTKGHYGSDFKYREAVSTKSLVGASLISVFMVVAGAVLNFGPLRAFAMRYLPKPGEGPSRETMFNGYWKHAAIGLTEEEPGTEPQVVVAKCSDPHRDGGYWSTARMLLESGLCLALDSDKLKEAGQLQGGVLTPATAMGLVLAGRLREAGITFDVVQSPALKQAAE
ncbi:saccharopine dehydrogenase (NAD(+),L-glutamate-forming) [Monoraphidium neglectum]|uniref:Saccharopine dehydrogenase (NAD(+),L-glutamate-forming) n=1 Tax=Monoraphidium neglectum TaxID=145388 RepID=A0A0D2JCK0_9CHLO|nr:saccharopine dehydrogenase (NAD(+),L-glutamate-forming) [Monoraphidium neglectum]KIY97407.1 saccharopine dehydrogenase (NAD(+),L-glutamate-forming) [Monoraphidium neglectum]|eukprot:XP_013896427.1 saccharopine dehydrogenase (NAD(+),L-glutamate-forming) [Monoraphidium neglectum]